MEQPGLSTAAATSGFLPRVRGYFHKDLECGNPIPPPHGCLHLAEGCTGGPLWLGEVFLPSRAEVLPFPVPGEPSSYQGNRLE